MIIFLNHNKQVVHRPQKMDLKMGIKWRERQTEIYLDIEQKAYLAELNIPHSNTLIQITFNIKAKFTILSVSYLEKFVSGYWEVYTTTIFADMCINPYLLLDLLCSCMLKSCGHGGSNGDGDTVPSGGVILNGRRGGLIPCGRALSCLNIILGGHAGFECEVKGCNWIQATAQDSICNLERDNRAVITACSLKYKRL